MLPESAVYLHCHRLATYHRIHGVALVVQHPNTQDFTRSIAVTMAGTVCAGPDSRKIRAVAPSQDCSHVPIDHVVWFALGGNLSVQQENRTIGKLFNQTQIVRHKEHRDLALLQLFKLPHATIRKDSIAYGEGFIDHQDLRINVNSSRKSQSDVHAAGILFYWS